MNKKILKKAEEILKQRKFDIELTAKLNFNKATANKAFYDIFLQERTLTIEKTKKKV